MDLISEFGYIISKNTDLDFNAIIPQKSKLRKLYNIVINEGVKTDEEAAQIIYKTGKADKKYLMLKRNLVHKLADLVYKQDYYESEEDNYKTIQFQVEKELLIAEKLLLQNVYHNPTKMIKKAEQTAEKYFLIDIQVASAKLFRSVYALKGFPTETEEYDQKYKQLIKFQSHVSDACGMWERLYATTKFSIAKTELNIQQTTKFSNSINQWLNEYYSPFLLLYKHRIDIIRFNQQNNFESLFVSISELNKLVTSNAFLSSKTLMLEIFYNFALYYRNTKQLNKAQEYLNRCFQITDYRAFDKFLIQALQWDVYLKLADYKKATVLINEVINVPQFGFLDPYDKAEWNIREAYNYFILFATSQTEDYKLLPHFKEDFDLNGFLSRTKKAGKDKLGYNINLLIIRILLYTIKNEKEIDKEGNNLKIYFHRYLKDMNSKRTSLFFQYLSKLAAVDFDKNLLENQIYELKKELEKTATNQFDIFEWIPFSTFADLLKTTISTIER